MRARLQHLFRPPCLPEPLSHPPTHTHTNQHTQSIEGYYQEAGRAGRDGAPAECVLMYGRADIPRIAQMLRMCESLTVGFVVGVVGGSRADAAHVRVETVGW